MCECVCLYQCCHHNGTLVDYRRPVSVSGLCVCVSVFVHVSVFVRVCACLCQCLCLLPHLPQEPICQSVWVFLRYGHMLSSCLGRSFCFVGNRFARENVDHLDCTSEPACDVGIWYICRNGQNHIFTVCIRYF